MSEREFEDMEPGLGGWTEWVHPLPGYLMKCCDCGLVHELATDVDDEGRVLIRMRREPEARCYCGKMTQEAKADTGHVCSGGPTE